MSTSDPLEHELCCVVRSGDLERVRALLAIGVPADAPSQHVLPLSLAADRGFLEIVRALLAAGADPNCATRYSPRLGNFDRLSPLDHAIEKSEDMVLALVEAGADLTRPMEGSNEGLLPRDRIEATPWERARALLESRGAPRSLDDALGLVPAILAGRVARVMALLDDTTIERRHRPLVMAAHGGATTMIQLLVAEGVHPQAIQEALFHAIQGGHLDAVRALLDAGADLDARTTHYWGPGLLVAAACGRTEIAKLLLARGANPNQQFEAQTPLKEAAQHPETLAVIQAASGNAKAERKRRAATKTALYPHTRRAWRPILVRSEGEPRGSRLGGRPWLAGDEQWPLGRDGAPLEHVLTLDLAAVPEDFRVEIAEAGTGLVRVFRSASTTETAVLVTTSTDGALVDPDIARPSRAVAIVGWMPLTRDFPNGEAGTESHRAIRVGGRTPLDATIVKALNHTGHELGGWPHWAQEPRHAEPGVIDRLVFQIDDDSVLGFLFQSTSEPTKLVFLASRPRD